jgi:hypothetical protein
MTMPSKRKVTIENLGEFRWLPSKGCLYVEPINKPGNMLCITDQYDYYWTPKFVCDTIKNAIKNRWDIQGKSQVNYYSMNQLYCTHEYVQYYDTNREICNICNRIQL